jgi:hypothetical protein
MYITDPSVVINNGDELATAPVPRDPTWLAEHHAGAIVQFRVGDLNASGGTLLGPSNAEQ